MTAPRRLLLPMAAVLGSVLVGYAVTRDGSSVTGAFGLAALIVLASLAPRRWLPPIALCASLLLPTQSFPLPVVLVGYPMGLVPFGVWLARSPTTRVRWNLGRLLGVLLGLWIFASELFAPIRTNKGMLWCATALVAVCLMTWWGRSNLELERFKRLFSNLTAALGLYAIAEAFVLKSNPIYGSLYAHAPTPLVQHWSEYRPTTLMGHPLINATVFAAALVLAAAELIRGSVRVGESALRVGILGVALATTQSRGGILAALVGVVFILVAERGHAGIGWRKSLVVLAGIAAVAGFSAVLSARDSSQEGKQSVEVRENVLKQTETAMVGTSVLGAGPNEVEAWRQSRRLPEVKVPIENSYADIAVSIGIPGLLLFVALALTYLIVGIRDPRAAPQAAALLTILVAIGGYNAIESPNSLVLIGLFMAGVLAAHGQVELGHRPARWSTIPSLRWSYGRRQAADLVHALTDAADKATLWTLSRQT